MAQRKYCSGTCSQVAARSTPHPAVTMSKARADVWAKTATEGEFYEHLQDLAAIYAKRHYIAGQRLDETALFIDYKKWKDDYASRLQEKI